MRAGLGHIVRVRQSLRNVPAILKTAFLIAAFVFYAAGTVRLARALGPRWVTRTVISAATAIVVGAVALIASSALIGPMPFFHDAAELRDVRSLAGGILVAAVVGGVLAMPIGRLARGGVATHRSPRKQ